jgi:hypothetical protein
VGLVCQKEKKRKEEKPLMKAPLLTLLLHICKKAKQKDQPNKILNKM